MIVIFICTYLEHVYELKEYVKMISPQFHAYFTSNGISTDRIQQRVRVRVIIVHVLVHIADLNLSNISRYPSCTTKIENRKCFRFKDNEAKDESPHCSTMKGKSLFLFISQYDNWLFFFICIFYICTMILTSYVHKHIIY